MKVIFKLMRFTRSHTITERPGGTRHKIKTIPMDKRLIKHNWKKL